VSVRLRRRLARLAAWAVAALGLLSVDRLSAAPAGAEITLFARWPTQSALTTLPGHLILGVFSAGSYSTHERLELRLHPLWFLVLPHVEAKLRWLDHDWLQLGSAHRLVYASPFLGLVAREGTGGLLPPTTDVPFAWMLESDAIGSLRWFDEQWISLRLGAQVALAVAGDPVLLDFPFLYQRFAPLAAPWVPSLALSLDGTLARRAFYTLDYRYLYLPLDGFEAFGAHEWSARVYLEVARGHRVGLGGRWSVARFPIGWRTHALPFIDYQFSL
jgi:hypothetical protein